MDTQPNISSQNVLEELVAIGFARATDYFIIDDGALRLRSTDEMSEQAVKAIASVERGSTGLKLKLYDKLKALELLGKHCGFFNETPQQQENNLLQAILAATGQEVDLSDIPELQQTADPGDDMVE